MAKKHEPKAIVPKIVKTKQVYIKRRQLVLLVVFLCQNTGACAKNK